MPTFTYSCGLILMNGLNFSLSYILPLFLCLELTSVKEFRDLDSDCPQHWNKLCLILLNSQRKQNLLLTLFIAVLSSTLVGCASLFDILIISLSNAVLLSMTTKTPVEM